MDGPDVSDEVKPGVMYTIRANDWPAKFTSRGAHRMRPHQAITPAREKRVLYIPICGAQRFKDRFATPLAIGT